MDMSDQALQENNRLLKNSASLTHSLVSSDTRPWDCLLQSGPIITTAIHAGHSIRNEMRPWLEISDMDRLREEDPLTDYFLPVGDSLLRVTVHALRWI